MSSSFTRSNLLSSIRTSVSSWMMVYASSQRDKGLKKTAGQQKSISICCVRGQPVSSCTLLRPSSFWTIHSPHPTSNWRTGEHPEGPGEYDSRSEDQPTARPTHSIFQVSEVPSMGQASKMMKRSAWLSAQLSLPQTLSHLLQLLP